MDRELMLDRKRQRQRAYREANPEKVAASKRAYVVANAEKVAASKRRRYLASRERTLAQKREYYLANAERIAAQGKAYREANADLIRARHRSQEARRRARKANSPVVESIDREQIIARDGQRCHICNRRVSASQIHLDHIVPLAVGGEHTARNLAVAHASCNQSKGARAVNDQLRLIG